MKAFLIPSLAAAGFSAPADGTILVASIQDAEYSIYTKGGDLSRYLEHDLPFTLAAHSSHASHGSHGSHGSHESHGSHQSGHSNHASHQSHQRSVTPTPAPPKITGSGRNRRSTPPTSILPINPQTVPKIKGGTQAFALITFRVQLGLDAYGYYSSTIDGVLDSETKTAIISYQRDHGLSVTGTLSNELIKALNIPTY